MENVLAKRLVIDKKVDVEETYQPVETVFISGTNKSLYQYTADSFNSSSIIINNVTPPSLSTVVARKISIQMTLDVTTNWDNRVGGGQFNAIAGFTSAGGATYAGTASGLTQGQRVPLYANIANAAIGAASVCLRANPLAQCLSTADVRINGTSTNVSFTDYAMIYQYLNDHENTMLYSSQFPLQRDNSPVFENASARSPFALLNANPYEPSRASFAATLISTAYNGGTNIVTNNYRIVWTEQLPISPFLTGKDQENVGLSNINNITLNLRVADFLNAFAVLPVATPATIALNLSNTTEAPILLMEYITPNSILAASQPPVLVYDYQQIQPYLSPTQLGTAGVIPAAVGTFQAVSSSLRLTAIPSLFYVYAKPRNSQAGSINIPNMMLNIQSVKILFNNRVNLLVDFTPAQLYQLSVKNGLKQSWNEWNTGIGSLMIVNVAEDLGLSESEQAGQGNSYCTLQVITNFSNQNLVFNSYAGGVAFDYYVTTVTPGKAFVSKSQCEFSISSAPTPAEVLAITADSPKLLADDIPSAESVTGGSLGHLLKRGLSVVRSGLSAVKPEHLKMASDALGSLGGGVAGAGMAGMRHRRGK